MDRKEQIEVTSFECIKVEQYYKYILKAILDGEPIQANIQQEDAEMTLEEFLIKAKDGMIKERYR
jgi:hypothetical protein